MSTLTSEVRSCSGDIRESTWYKGSTLAQNARDVVSSPTLCTIFPIFITPTTISLVTNEVLNGIYFGMIGSSLS